MVPEVGTRGGGGSEQDQRERRAEETARKTWGCTSRVGQKVAGSREIHSEWRCGRRALNKLVGTCDPPGEKTSAFDSWAPVRRGMEKWNKLLQQWLIVEEGFFLWSHLPDKGVLLLRLWPTLHMSRVRPDLPAEPPVSQASMLIPDERDDMTMETFRSLKRLSSWSYEPWACLHIETWQFRNHGPRRG